MEIAILSNIIAGLEMRMPAIRVMKKVAARIFAS
jgi:hypothetical protein